MTSETIGMVAAGLGVLASITYVILGIAAIRTLRQVRDRPPSDVEGRNGRSGAGGN
jgi:hypothetical protein